MPVVLARCEVGCPNRTLTLTKWGLYNFQRPGAHSHTSGVTPKTITTSHQDLALTVPSPLGRSSSNEVPHLWTRKFLPSKLPFLSHIRTIGSSHATRIMGTFPPRSALRRSTCRTGT